MTNPAVPETQHAIGFPSFGFTRSRLTGALDNCKVVVAVLDGPDADSGTSVEMGYARGRGKRVIGVRTDFRSSKDHGLNLMLANGCSDLVVEPSTTATPERLAERIVSVLTAGESLAPQGESLLP